MRTHLKQTLGLRIRSIRLAQGMTQEALSDRMKADEANFSVESISAIERGRSLPGLDTLYRIASALDVPMGKLLDLDEDAPTDPERAALEARLTHLAKTLPDDRLKMAVTQVEVLLPDTEEQQDTPKPVTGKRIIRV